MAYYVKATIKDVGPILCSRPYPRSGNHLDPFGYPTRHEALAAARDLADRFPDNVYQVTDNG